MQRRAARLLQICLLLPVAIVTGCATITGSEVQNLAVQATDNTGTQVAGAECRLNNDKGYWSVKPPGFVMVHKSAQDLQVVCEAPNQKAGMVTAISRANAGLAGNIIFGGGIGAIIDHSRGTAYDYPSQIRVVFGGSRTIDKANETGSMPALASYQQQMTPPPEAPAPAQAQPQPAMADAAPAKTAAPGLPAPGAWYQYQWSDLKYGRKQKEFVVRVVSVDGTNVGERWENSINLSVVASEELALISRRLDGDAAFMELSPYMPAAKMVQVQTELPQMNFGGDFDIKGAQVDWDKADIPAGTYRALRVTIRGSRDAPPMIGFPRSTVVNAFEYTAWYAPDVKRCVMMRYRTWNASGEPFTDEQVALVAYSGKK